jgi:hypothetical protein
VLLPTSTVKSYSPEDGASKSGSKVSYAALGRQAPWAVQELKVHFHHDKPFKRVSFCRNFGECYQEKPGSRGSYCMLGGVRKWLQM